MNQSPKLICVVGARPNFVKMTSIWQALTTLDPKLSLVLVHTGQHYDKALAESFFDHLHLPVPDHALNVGSGSQAQQTAKIMLRFEQVLEQEKPGAILVVGDVNSTLACSLVASKMNVPVIHVEAGLRSFDKTMPEEINRILTDQLSSLHFTTESSANQHLLREGIAQDGIHFVGNVMIDTLHTFKKHAIPHHLTLPNLGLDPSLPYGILTLHRPSNVENPKILYGIIKTLLETSVELPILFPVHPRTKQALSDLPFEWSDWPQFKRLEPLEYLTMLGLLNHASLVLTDSGGLQEETTLFGVPCLTLRNNTERPITLSQGTNHLVGTDPNTIRNKINSLLAEAQDLPQKMPPLWDGQASMRIAQILIPWLYQCEKKEAACVEAVS